MSSYTPIFARQPIFNGDLDVIAYELLFRQSNKNHAAVVEGDLASSQVLNNAFIENRIADVLGKKHAFINFTRNLLVAPPPLPAKQLVIEVLEDIEADKEVMEGIVSLRKQGFKIALDDFEITESTKRMLPLAHIVKVDVLAHDDAGLLKITKLLKPFKVKLLAEKVETHDMLKKCQDFGFDWYQGYFLSKPQIVKGVKVSQGRQAILQLISTITNPKVEVDEIVEAIASDLRLSYKFLQLVNSPAVGLSTQVGSLTQAITLLGIDKVRSWATFFLMANNDDKPRELCVLSLSRAKFCELLTSKIQDANMGETAFTVGLLSNIDAFLDMPMDKIVKELNLSTPIEVALIQQEGLIGEILRCAAWYEKGEWTKVDWKLLSKHKFTSKQLNQYYTESVTWASQTVEDQA